VGKGFRTSDSIIIICAQPPRVRDYEYMKRRRLYHTAAVLATSLAAFGPGVSLGAAKESKKVRPTTERNGAQKRSAAAGSTPPEAKAKTLITEAPGTTHRPIPLESALTSPLGLTTAVAPQPAVQLGQKYPWRTNIVTTTFWVGEDAAPNNPVPNVASSWDPNWSKNYGGVDTPKREGRSGFQPASFTPGQNPFYIALPYNDVTKGHHKPEAASMIPWFKEAYQQDGRTVLKGRWVAIRFKDKVAYAQWEDCGPFRTDHAAYVFGDERPKPNLNRGAGLDVSPAVRDYLGMNDTDVTDWKFVDFSDVPRGPWATLGENNTFVMKDRAKDQPVVLFKNPPPGATW
jgi:hypothetical protein